MVDEAAGSVDVKTASSLEVIDPVEQSKREFKPVTPPTEEPTRSLTPSDFHYHTAPHGGVNAALTPISHHYQTNQTLLDLFSTLYEKDQFSVAYAVGVKFVEVALFQIPQHGYYKSGGVAKERTKSAADAIKVTKMLGGMVDEMEDDTEGPGGLEKVEALSKLANVAHQSFEEALDDELNSKERGSKEEKRSEDHIGAATAQMSRIWKDYVMGGEDGAQNNLCALPDKILPDNICSFWKLGKTSRSGSSIVDDAVDDAIVEDSCGSSYTKKKRPRIDKESLPLPPKPPTVPEVFIRRDSTQDDDGAQSPTAESHDNRVVVKKVSESSGSDMQEQSADTTPMEVDIETPRVTHVIAHPPSALRLQEDASMEEVEKKLEVTTTKEAVPDKPLVVKGRPIQQQQPRVDGGVFHKDELQLALSLSMSMQENPSAAVVSLSSEDAQSTTAAHISESQILSLTQSYERQYHMLKNDKNKFHVRFLDTFQGRNPKSTNGCTVIAPLTCIQYFTSVEQNDAPLYSTTWENGIPDDLINQVIDEHAAAVLPEVRNKLNLEGDSFIIPSDVHDHLIDTGLLSTSQFVGVCGGNILDDDHLASFKSSLLLLDDKRERERLNGRKVAATFFFHGHVIALHVVTGSSGNVWIELIDSLPNPETWIQRQPSSSMMDEPPQPSFSNSEEWERQPTEYDDELPMNAVRVRCTDVEHFDTLIRHYACSKFSDEEQTFIDTTVWDDNNGYCESSFDPRVFQAFIWCEAA